jgi:proline dehydrogenase
MQSLRTLNPVPLRRFASKNKVFEHDSTFRLINKYLVYKVMSSNLCINYSLVTMHYAYKLVGKRITNFLIEKTASSIFTGGTTVHHLL